MTRPLTALAPLAAGLDRWTGLVVGIVWAGVDTLLASALGFRFEIGGRDATALVALWFGVSFAALGFAVGYAVEARRRDRAASATIQAQQDVLAATRGRLAQQEKLAALGQLASSIAHEVRNPLAVIRSAAQGLQEEAAPDDGHTRRACGFVITEIDRLSSVVTSLLAFARPLQPALRPVAVGDVVARALALADEELRDRGVRVERAAAPGLPALRVDPDLVCQLLLGLLSNAGEAAGRAGLVTIDARSAGDAVELEVADSGPGVPAELRERVFEPFFTTRQRGTGLGLAVARQIAEAHGGAIHVGERAGGGARFVVRLPATAAAVAA
ncbi:MAG: hypothetical protein KIT14_19720 [bacterium]|nr:hypothetical protein [bacterium]